MDKLDLAFTNADDRIMLVMTQQWRPRHELAWIWTDLLSEQRRATGLVETAGGAARADDKRQPA